MIETQDTEIIQKEQLSDDEESDATRRPLDQPVGISARYGSIARPQLSIIENDSIFGTENGSEEDDEQETLRLAELSRREQVMKSYEEFSSSTPDDDDEDDDENSYSSSDQFYRKMKFLYYKISKVMKMYHLINKNFIETDGIFIS